MPEITCTWGGLAMYSKSPPATLDASSPVGLGPGESCEQLQPRAARTSAAETPDTNLMRSSFQNL